MALAEQGWAGSGEDSLAEQGEQSPEKGEQSKERQ